MVYLGPIVPGAASAPPSPAQAPAAPVLPVAPNAAVDDKRDTQETLRKAYDRRRHNRRQARDNTADKSSEKPVLDTRDGSDRRQSPRGSIDVVV